MPTGGRPTLTQFLIEERRRHPDATGDLNALVTDVSLACKAISRKVAFGALADMLGHVQDNTVNVQGEEQKTLDVVSAIRAIDITTRAASSPSPMTSS